MVAVLQISPRKHEWGDPERLGEYAERTERICVLCGLVKITIHPPRGLPWREWRTRAGRTWQGVATPPCMDEVTA
jgi:hypothetical protein